MKATQSLPQNYQPAGKFSLKSIKQLVVMNIFGLILLIISIWFFPWFTEQVRPDFNTLFQFEFGNLSDLAFALIKIILPIIFVLLIHEAIHTFFFWFFSKQKPVVGFKGAYAYAAMPGWYFPRNQYLIIGISPLLLITLFGMLLLLVVPIAMIDLILIALIINTSGAIGDLFVVIWLLTKPATTYALDEIDTIEFFVPNS